MLLGSLRAIVCNSKQERVKHIPEFSSASLLKIIYLVILKQFSLPHVIF